MKSRIHHRSRPDGFTIIEMMVSTGVVMLVMAGALTAFRNALNVNDTASQLADANQNLRAGTNQLVRDLLMAGRMIGTEGIAMPTGAGITFARPGPGVTALTFSVAADTDATVQLPSISTGFQLGPTINGSPTDMITILTVDEFMPFVSTPPADPNTPGGGEGTISPDGTYVQFATTSQWINGDTVNDTAKMQVGDLVYYWSPNGNAIQTITSIDTTTHRIYFATGDYFRFNQANATNELANTGRPLATLKRTNTKDAAGNPTVTKLTWPADQSGAAGKPQAPFLCPSTGGGVTMTPASNFCAPVTLFRALMVTYYVDNTTTPGTPRLTRVINHCPPSVTCTAFAAQALAGVVEDLDLTYDLYDGVINPTAVQFLPQTLGTPATLFTANQIRKVNIHVGVRSEMISKPQQDYVRNHITTSVNVRSLAAVDKYPS